MPLVTNAQQLRCSLDILFLRPETAGKLSQSGDLDGRIKTVFDALRMPDNLAEVAGQTPQEDEKPFFVLLQDDKLINDLRVTTDQLLLLPDRRELNANDAFLVIDVSLQNAGYVEYGWVFSHG